LRIQERLAGNCGAFFIGIAQNIILVIRAMACLEPKQQAADSISFDTVLVILMFSKGCNIISG